MPTLTNQRHELFAQELAKGKSADEAYITAGYKPNRHNASTLKSKQTVSNRVAELLTPRAEMISQVTQKAADELGMSKAWVMARLKENAERALQAVPVTDSEGNIIEYKYEGNVANRALELLGKEIGMFITRTEVGNPGDFSEMTDEALQQYVVAEALALGAAVKH